MSDAASKHEDARSAAAGPVSASPVTAPPPPARAPWAEATRGLAIALVVAFHATLFLQTAGVDVALGRAKALFELFPMPVFFLVAGMAASAHRRLAFRNLWWRRLVPLLYLYVLWSVIRTLFYLVVPGLNQELGELPATHPLTLPLLLLWPSSSYWFLYALVLLTLARWLMAPLPAPVQLGGAAVVSSLFSAGIVDTGNLGWNRVGALLFFFVAGAVLTQPIKRAVAGARNTHLLALVVALALVFVGLLAGLRSVPPVALVGQALAVAVGILIVTRLSGGPIRRFLSAYGSESLRVYLVHLFLIVPAVAVVAALSPDWPRPVDVVVQVGFIAGSLAGSLWVARLMGRVRWLVAPPLWLMPARRTPARPSAASA